ncbi:MAG TPA: hypothetical protein VGQ92_06385 [Actinoplanes sp.]|jgi:hypothetical protein|nr:hypothetical protein [Actinoplanes sp.]
MTFPVDSGGGDRTGPPGYTYAGVVVRLDGAPSGRACTREDVLAALREIRYSGWLGQPEDGWLVAVAASGDGTVAAGRRGVVGVGESLADRLGATVFAFRVVTDRQLLVALWADGEEVGRYLSDPSHGLDDDTLSDPVGVEHADGFAAACGHPEAAEDLAELLAEELDPDSVIESERLGRVLRLLGLPRWLVAASSLPRDIPTGPRSRDMTRLGAGVPGFRGRLRGAAVGIVRRRRPPPPAITDAPRRGSDIDPWML